MRCCLFLIAVLVWCSQSSADFTPTSDCGRQGQICYNANKDRIRKKFEENDLTGGCKANRMLLSCLNGIQGSDTCTDIINYKSLVHNMTADICDTNNPAALTVCGNQLETCLNQMLIINADFNDNQAQKACPLMDLFKQCSNAIIEQNTCPKRITDLLDKAKSWLSEKDLVKGCDGQCGKLIGNCTLKMVYDMVDKPAYKINFTDFCVQAYASKKCVESIPTNSGPCAGNAGATSLAEDTIHGYTAYLQDYCDASGKPSRCVIQLNECDDDIVNIKNNTPISDQCQAAAKFLECTSRMDCENSMKTTIDSVRKQFDTQEIAEHCPTVGSCSDRILQCDSVKTQLAQVNNQTDKTKFCQIVEKAVSCYEFVRHDPTCTTESLVVGDFETMLAVDIAPYCGDSVGTCDERMHVCDMNERIATAADNTTQKTEFCRRAMAGLTCFDGVRKDGNCSVEKSKIGYWEDKLRNAIQPFCNSGSVTQLLPFLMMVPLIILVNKYLQL